MASFSRFSSVKLGPRIIPYFRAIISQSIAFLRGNNPGKTLELFLVLCKLNTFAALFEDAFNILHGLLTTIPTFWGSGEVTQIIFLFMDHFTFTPTALSSRFDHLTKALAKLAPAKVVLSALLEIWGQTQGSKNLVKNFPLSFICLAYRPQTRISAFFEVLGRVLQRTDRPTVLDTLRNTFSIFLEALDIVKLHEEVSTVSSTVLALAKSIEQAESRVVSSFRELVVKLNESAFKPLFRRLYDWAFAGETGMCLPSATILPLNSSQRMKLEKSLLVISISISWNSSR